MSFAVLSLADWLCVAGSGFGCAYLLFAGYRQWRFLRRRAPSHGPTPPVSVLKPLCGEDPDLAENLRSFCRQDHPAFQIVFGVRDADDPAVPIVRELMAEFPDRDLALVIDDRRHGGNLKVANLQNMLPAARHAILVIADSDMRVTPDYLATVTGALAHGDVGLVTCLYRGIPAGGIWSALACLHVNHGFLPQAIVGEAVGTGAGCFGATIALRRETLEEIGGFAVIADVLADDHALGAAVRQLPRRVVLSHYLVDNIIAEPSLAQLFRHELRWARTIRLLAPLGFAGSVVTQPVALAALAVALGALPIVASAALAAALVVRWASVWFGDRALGLRPTPPWLVPLRDMLSFAVFAASFWSRSVAWRDRTFRVGPNGQLILDGDSPA
jgi:ceramide glucosyltransferase